MKLETTLRFNDLEADKIREKGDVFEADPKRASELMSIGYVKKVEEPKTEEKPKPAAK